MQALGQNAVVTKLCWYGGIIWLLSTKAEISRIPASWGRKVGVTVRRTPELSTKSKQERRLQLKLKTIHTCFLYPYKTQSSMLCFFTNTCEVTMQVILKRAIRKATLLYNEYMCLCWVSTLFCMICCKFSNCIKSSTTRLRSLYITFYLCCKCATFFCLYSSQCNET